MSQENERLVIDLAPRVQMAFRLIPPGSLMIGARGERADEEPRHRVTVTRPFWLGETSVTQAQFAVWTQAEKIDHRNHFPDTPERRAMNTDWSGHPAENLDWFQAAAFCGWLTRACRLRQPSRGLPEGAWACLPTEAEWEYACRARTDTEYHTGDGEAALADAGWFGAEWDRGSTHPAGSKLANAFGLFDLHGNVWDWCHDIFEERAYALRVDGVCDPGGALRETENRAERGFESGGNCPPRVLRGGSWNFSAWNCRSAFRLRGVPVNRYRSIGFRVCLVPGPFTTETAGPVEPAPGDAGRGTSPESEGAGGASDPATERLPPA